MNSRFLWQLARLLPLTVAVIVGFTDSKHVFAQLTPDNSLGGENSIVTPQQLRDLIQGGAIRDGALFHSFDEFNVGSDRGVFFDLQNNTDILNIFTRVTGGNVSNILGTLGVLQDALNSDVLGNANLFLLNPNGITFGANANLQLNGSFFATTADGFGFEGNQIFSASGEEAPPPLLTVNIPNFLDFRNNAGNIAVNGSNLSVTQGQNLSFVGGNVSLDNANLTANGGTIQIAGLSGNGSASLSLGGFSLGSVDTEVFNSGSVTINGSEVNTDNDVSIGFSGFITIDALENISLTDSNLSSNGSLGIIRLGSTNLTPNTVTTNNSSLTTNSAELNQNTLNSSIFAGRIDIYASELISLTNSTLSNNGRFISINTLNFGTTVLGFSGTNTITIDNSEITAQENTGEGFAGDVLLNAANVTVTNESNVSSNGNSGRVFVGNSNFTETVTIDDSTLTTDSTLAARNNPNSDVNIFAGVISINSLEQISLTNATLNNNGQFNVNNNFGTITLGSSATNAITINNSEITAQEETDEGLAGDVFLNAINVTVTESFINTNGRVGRIFVGNLGLTETATINNSQITAQENNESGLAGDVFIDATNVAITDSNVDIDGDFGRIFIGDLDLTETVTINNSDLTTNNNDTGTQAGSININASEFVEIINDSTISANTPENSTGIGGNISIDPERVTIQDSTISVNSQGSGPAGTITLDADNLTLDNGQITATTNNSDGGDITLRITDLLLLVNGSNISTNAGQSGGEGTGGDIDISARFVVATPTEDNNISANAVRDNAGDVNIRNTEIIFGIQPRDEDTGLSDITATSEVGASGTISIDNQQATDPSQGLIELPEEVADESTFVVGGVCSIGGGSEFIVRGRGGVPYIPGLVTQNSVVNIDLVDEVLLPAPPPEAIKPHHRTDVTFLDSNGEEFKPAMGAVLLPDGMVEFVDYNPAEVYRDMYAAAGCSR